MVPPIVASVLFPALLGAVVHNVTGVLTYGPLFGKQWLAALRREKRNPTLGTGQGWEEDMPRCIAINTACNVVKCAIHLHILRLVTRSQPTSFTELMSISALLWLGFQVPVHISQVLWEERVPLLNITASVRELVDLGLTVCAFMLVGAL